jgi:hypothetical protein
VPIEIRELVIRAVVDSGPAPAVDDATGEPAGPAAASPERPAPETIVQECVRQVLRILATGRER